jgi:L-ribulose-5-phosphate 4-epimerase
MIDEGYIKYQCSWIERQSISEEDIAELNQWRRQLYQLGLIGQYENGIGFGNISIRIPQSNELIISGTQTGGIPDLTPQHYTKVTEFDWRRNQVTCEGLIKASSETLTHAAIYVAAPEVNAVVHVHHQQLWHKLINCVPTTNPTCRYGTPEMAQEIIKLCQQNEVKRQKIVIMSGHNEGILTFGKNLSEAADKLRDYL